jgi:asparagine synthase (glutamine-hydrolysing)
MCGIAGIARFDGRPIEERRVGRMCAAIRHRGPDDHGVMRLPRSAGADRRPSAVLGSQRLSIIDLAGGHQPIANEDGSVWTVLNGEIYNFLELRRELESRGHRFATCSDTEVLVHLYEERGADFVSALDGMFALALWDDRLGRLLLARDRFGKKPLLYSDVDGELRFASEFQALLADGSTLPDIDLAALDCYLTYLAIPAPLTIYRTIRKLPPAHVMTVDASGIRLHRYWTLNYTPKLQIDEREAGARVVELLTAAVKKRLISDVPLGALLSGGIDSSAVVALMARASSRPVKTFSIGFEDGAYNELPHARRVARAFGCDHREFLVTPRAVEILPTLVRHFGEPFADSSAIPTYYLARLTRPHVTVALNGDGGDEAFAGYNWHLANRLAEQWQRVPSPLRRPLDAFGRRAVTAGADRRSWRARAARFVAGAAGSRAERYRAWVGVFSDDLKASLLSAAPPAAAAAMIDDLSAETAGLDAVDAMLALDTRFYLPTDLLVKMDVMTMANSLEARSPFLDHHLVEFAARLPSRFKLRRFTTKYLLRSCLEGIVPRENLWREKRGFAVPIGRWFRDELREFLCDHLLGSRLAARGLMRSESVRQLVEAHVARRADYTHHLWVLLMLELWHREFVDAPAPAALAGVSS